MNEHSRVTLGPGWETWLAVGLVILAAAATIYYYRRTYRRFGRRFLVVSALLRLAALAALLACLFQPTQIITTTTVEKGRVILLMDNSKSMDLVDLDGGQSRWDEARRTATGEPDGLTAALAKRFDVACWTFADGAAPVSPEELRKMPKAEGQATWIGRAVTESVADLEGHQLAGLVLLSDGLDNGGDDPVAAAREVGAPVFAVSYGHAHAADFKDIAVESLAAPERVVRNEPMVFVATVKSTGYRNKVVPLKLDLGNKNIANELVSIQSSPSEHQVRIRYTPREKGTFTFTVTVPPDASEAIVSNNTRRVTVEVIEPTINVLYVEGALRFEFKFLRRVLAADPNLRVTTLLQVGPNAFYKQVTAGSAEAADAAGTADLPSTRFPDPEDLKKFDVIFFGDFDAKALSGEQLRTVAEAVEKQGAAFVMLGGQNSFGAGGYAGTPIADLLPVKIASTADGQENDAFHVDPTPEGLRHPAMKLDADEDVNLEIWKRMPALDGCNRVLGAKPGATVLLRHELRQGPPGTDRLVILAVQRYGKGKSVALTADTMWKWAFQVLGSGGSQTLYAAFWRQMLRWLLPDKSLPQDRSKLVRATTDKNVYRPGETVRIEATVLTPELQLANDAATRGQLRMPDGRTQDLELAKAPGVDGKYRATYLPRRLGRYDLTVRAERRGEVLSEHAIRFEVGSSSVELDRLDPDMKVLADMARATGGQLLRPAEAVKIAELLKPVDTEVVNTREELIWHTPTVLTVFIVLISLEWLLRRRYNLR